MPRTSAKWPCRRHAAASTDCAASASWLPRFKIDISASHQIRVEVRPEIRQAVRFIQANIVEAQGVLHGNTYDAVFCRNLVIYLTPTARQRIMQDVDRWLSPGGLFFVGHAEMLREFDELFEPVQERGAFAYCRRSGAKAHAIGDAGAGDRFGPLR